MKKSATLAKPREYRLTREALEADLEFPVAPDFISRPPRIAFHAMMDRIEKNLHWRNKRPSEQQRLEEKISVEFVF